MLLLELDRYFGRRILILKFIRPGGQACLPVGKFGSCYLLFGSLYSHGFRALLFVLSTPTI